MSKAAESWGTDGGGQLRTTWGMIVTFERSASRLSVCVGMPSYTTVPSVGMQRRRDNVKVDFPEPVRPTGGQARVIRRAVGESNDTLTDTDSFSRFDLEAHVLQHDRAVLGTGTRSASWQGEARAAVGGWTNG